MLQNKWSKNFTNTAIVVGMTFSMMSFNSTILIDDLENTHYQKPPIIAEAASNSTRLHYLTEQGNIYLAKETRLEREAKALFGTMREASPIEIDSVNSYINSISKKTGVNFFDLC